MSGAVVVVVSDVVVVLSTVGTIAFSGTRFCPNAIEIAKAGAGMVAKASNNSPAMITPTVKRFTSQLCGIGRA